MTSGVEFWKVNPAKTRWSHRINPNMHVLIRKNVDKDRNAPKYVVFHDHPGPDGRVIGQPLEYAKTMENARDRAYKHLRHWNDPLKWAKDPDYGKLGKAGT